MKSSYIIKLNDAMFFLLLYRLQAHIYYDYYYYFRDLKELGVTKIGHIKRIQQAVRDIKDNKAILP